MENFLLNFAAQIDISKININPGVRRTLSALTKSTSGTSKIKQEIELDVKTIGKVSDIGGDIVKDLQKSLSRIKVSPTAIMNQKDLGGITGRLEQIPTILKAINAQMSFILAKPELIPNAAESLGRLAALKRSLKEVRQETERGIKLQFSSELGPIRDLDNLILSAKNKSQDLRSQLDKLKSSAEKPASQVQEQTKKAFEAKSKIDAIRTERRSAKKLSTDEVAALKAQEASAVKRLEEAKAKREKTTPISAELKVLSKKEKDLTAPLFKAQSNFAEAQRTSRTEIEKAKSSLASEIANLEKLKSEKEKAEIQAASEGPKIQKIIRPKEAVLAKATSEKTTAVEELEKIKAEQAKILDDLRKKAQLFLTSAESPLVKAQAEFKLKTKDVKSIEQRKSIKREILDPFTEQKAEAEGLLKTPGFQPKDARFQALEKKRITVSEKVESATEKEKVASRELEDVKAILAQKNRIKAVNDAIAASEKKIQESIANVSSLEKLRADQLRPTKAGKSEQRPSDSGALQKIESDLATAKKQLNDEKLRLESAKRLAVDIQKSSADPDKISSASVKTKERIKSINEQIALSEKSVEEASKRVLSIEKQQQVQLEKLQGEYNSLKKAMDDTVAKRIKLEEKKKTGKTGLEGADARVIEAEKSLGEIRSKLLLTGEDPKQTKEFQTARNELKAALTKRNEALAQQKEIEKEILKIEGQLTNQQNLQIGLEAKQNAIISSMTGNLKQDLTLRKQIEDSINRAVKAEENLQSRISEAFAKSGKTYVKPDAREKALERLGVTEIEISAPPTQDFLNKVKSSRFNAAQSRGNDLAKALSDISSDERARILEEKFNQALKNLKLSQERRAKTTLASTAPLERGKIFEKEREDLIEQAFGKSVVGTSILRGESVSKANLGVATEDVVKTLRKIQEIIKGQTDEKRKQLQVEKELAAQERNRAASNKIIEDLMKEELRNRSRMVSIFAKQGINFDPNTGLATKSVRAGETAPPPTRVVEPITSSRETILRKLGITEAEVSSGDASVRAKIVSKSKEIALEREREYRSAQVTANKTIAADRLIVSLRELIARDLEIARRNAALSGGPAPTLAGSSAKILGSTLGAGVVNLSQARATFDAGSEADAVGTLNRVTEARKRQRQELNALEQAEARAARAAREAARAQQQENDRRARNIERINALLERSALLYEQQIRTANRLSRSGVPNVQSRPVDRAAINTAARATILGGVDPSTLSAQELENAANAGRRRLRDQQAALREFNATARDVSSGTRSAFELISKYSDNAFDRFGARVGLATERLAAYVTSGAGLYTVIAQTRQAIIETALLEKEITNIQQIFDSLSGEIRFADAITNSFDLATKKASDLKTLALELAQITGVAPVEIAQAAKTLAAAGFGGQGKPGFQETVRAVTFATLGPSFGNSQEIIDGLTASLNQFNRSLEETPYILGLVNQLSKDYAVESQDLFEAIKRGGGSFAAVGGSLEDFLKLVTIAREQTRESASVIGTSLKTISARLFTPKAEKLLKDLGLDPDQLLDPYERILAIAGKIKQAGGAAGNTAILSSLIDTRQTGRLFALLNSVEEFEENFQKKDIAGQAAKSIVEDVKKRLDDIGPTIDRIRISYFKFVEGIYNNPATKALLDIPAGLLGALSEVPKLGFSVGQAQFTAGNFINPAIQSSAIVGLAAVIRGSIRAYQQNLSSVRANTTALESVRQAINNLSTRFGTAPAPPLVPVGNQQTRGFRETLAGAFRGEGGRALLGIGLASFIPGIVNSVLPATNLDQDTQSEVASGVAAGANAALIANFLGASLRLTGIVGLVVGSLASLAVSFENDRRQRELSKLEQQSRDAILIQRFESAARSGRLPETDLPSTDKNIEKALKVIAKGPLLPEDLFDFSRPRTMSDFSDPFEIKTRAKFREDLRSSILTTQAERLAKIGGGEDLKANLSDALFSGDEKKRIRAQEKFLKDAKILQPGLDPLEAQKSLTATSENIQTALENLLNVRMTGVQDDATQRAIAVKEVAEEFSKKVKISGVSFSSKDVEKALQKYLELDEETGKFEQSLGRFKISIKSLYEEAEIAGRIMTSLGASIARSFDAQNIGIQRELEKFKRVSPNVETTRRLVTNPFVAPTIQPLGQTASVNTAIKTIESLSKTAPVNILSPEVLKLTKIIDGFLLEVSATNSSTREQIIRAFSDETLKALGGTQQETIEAEENRSVLKNVSVTNAVLGQQIEDTYQNLREIGPASKELFDLIRTSGPVGVQPFDLRELSKAITSGETGAGTRILGLQNAEQRIREQANLLIERQNLSIQNQIQASEALVATLIERKNTELELAKSNRDNQLTILSFKSTLGLVSKEFSSDFSQIIKNAELSSRGGPQDVSGISDLVNNIKIAQNEVNRVIQRIGSAGGASAGIPAQVSELISQINSRLPAFGINLGIRNNEIGSVASDLATSRALLERSIQDVFANLQEKFKNFGDTVESIGAKIQAQRNTLDSIITKLFSGSEAERAINQTDLLSGQRNAARIVAAASAVEPKFKTKELGQSEIIASDAIARAVAPIIKTLSQRDLTSLREYLNIAGSNQLDVGSTGEQVKAAIEAGFSSFIQTFGIQTRQSDIAANVQAGRNVIDETQKIADKLKEAGIEQANIMTGNLNLVSNEVRNLSAAIAAIPKQIDIVIKGINNVTVDFDINDVQRSMSQVGTQVYNQVVITLSEAFKRAGIPIPELR